MTQFAKILVTGATGFLGSHLLPKLTELGAEITCLVRESSDTSRLPKDVNIIRADLLTGEKLCDALYDQDILIHMAALLFGIDWQDYLNANVRCAEQIAAAMQACGQHAPKKVILISSQAATGPAGKEQPVNESTLPHPVSAYGWSKLLVERTLQSQYTRDLAILRPSIIYGSGDLGLLPVFKGIQ